MVVLQSQTQTGIAASWTLRRTKEAVLFQQHTNFQGWHGQNAAIETMLSNKPCDLKTPQQCNHSEANTLHTPKPGLTTACSHCCQSSGWASVKTTATYMSIPSTQLLARESIEQLLGWRKNKAKQHGKTYLISTTDKWLSRRTLVSSWLSMYIYSSHNALSYSCIARDVVWQVSLQHL